MGRGGGGRRSEHLHVGTHVRVGEHPKQIGLRSTSRSRWHAPRRSEHLHAGTHPKQIGLAQPLARDAHGDAPDELWLESMAYLWGEGERAP